MKYRPQRGSFSDSMNEAVSISGLKELADHIDCFVGDIELRYYYYDPRLSWGPTYIVLVKGLPVGFTDFGRIV